jgi:hypothetical protein
MYVYLKHNEDVLSNISQTAAGINPAIPEPDGKIIELKCAVVTYLSYFCGSHVHQGRVCARNDGKEYSAKCKGSITNSGMQKHNEN